MKAFFSMMFYRLFEISLFFYFFFFVIDLLKPGFIVHYFYVNIILGVTIIYGICSVFFKANPSAFSDKAWYVWLRLLIQFLISFGIILFLYRELSVNDYGPVIAFVGGFVYASHIILFLFSRSSFKN